VGASASLNNASAESHGVLASQLARIRKADLFHKQAEEILELGQDALACISLGNVIHLVLNKLLVSWLFWGKDNILTNCTNLSDTIGPHLYR
jgi:hypothetical protein